MLRRFAPFVLLLALIGGACADGDDGETASSTTTSPADPAGEDSGAPSVNLLDAGAEPRQQLRLRPQVGAVQRVTMRHVLEQEVIGAPPSPAPATEFDVTYEVVSVEPGRVQAEMVYDDARVADTGGADAATVQQLEQVLDSFVGARGLTVVSERGDIVEVEAPNVDLPPSMAAFGDQLLQSIEEQATMMAMPFPEEPVGVGARWRVSSEMEVGGIPMRSSFELVLTEAGADGITADVTGVLTMVPGPVDIFGTQIEIKDGQLDLQGTIRWATNGIMALVDQTSTGSVTMAGPDGEVLTMNQRQTITITER